MNYSDNDRKIIKVLGFLSMLYPRFELDDGGIAAYLRILGDLPADLIEQAAEDLGSTSTFFPAAAELRRAAFDLVEQAQGIPSAYEAWQQIKSGFNGRQLEMHPLALEAINTLGGLYAFGQSSIEDESSWRARFIQSYEILVRRQRRDLDMLPGVKAFTARLAAGDSAGLLVGSGRDEESDDEPVGVES